MTTPEKIDASKLREELVEALTDARLQIEYLHERFGETGSGNSVLARIKAAIAKAEASAP